MAHSGPPPHVKRAQKESFLLRELSQLISKLIEDQPILATISATRVDLSKGKGICNVYFSSTEGKEGFLKALEVLKLYRNSLRNALSKARQSRHTPELMFLYDEQLEREMRMHKLLDTVKEDSEDEG